MIKGIGIDLIEIGRIKELIERQERFPGRVLAGRENEEYSLLPTRRRAEYLAGRFAAKEAFAKALGTGIGASLSFQDIEVGKDELGKPYFVRPEKVKAHLSITHTKEYAAAHVVIEES
ncbi:holo-ACP synthase [Neobacillus piezotolerans]|uniref:Holo-[acyl-carrier-protein] synthase n=1 Tax=Neobacillus piezotolerans TaxID=2259171 RepID=A0A3D8GK65_9BACI|nr:holo-ACP synthase [Neobacillus piezotolerans]RDU34840.1 holo-ACP synthase [Neobacillus piezotolerans]